MRIRLRNIKIGTQLFVGFTVILLFFMTLGVVSYNQTKALHLQTETMYTHPLQVRRALGELKGDILKIELGLRDLALAKNDDDTQTAIQLIELSSEDAKAQLSLVREQYLGLPEDVNEMSQAYYSWIVVCEENIQRALLGDKESIAESIANEEKTGSLTAVMMSSMQKIELFAQQKADELYSTSIGLANMLNRQLISLSAAVFIIALLIGYVLTRNIRKPLKEMNDAVNRFHDGDMDFRLLNPSKNEFGVLASSINILEDRVQKNTFLDKKITDFARTLFISDDIDNFFQILLGTLTSYTGSQIAAVYLLSEDQKTYEYFKSVGTDDQLRYSFAADRFEGEFGAVLLSHKLHHIQNIPENTRFIFPTINGKFIPSEMITIPVLSGEQVIAIISLASLFTYSQLSMDLVESIMDVMSARIEGVLAYRAIKALKDHLETRNQELNIQSRELSTQAVELRQQNSELEMQKKQLHEASRLKTNFLSNMSHELRTPLNSVIALSGVLSRRLAEKIPQEEYSYLEIIERNGKNLLMLINDVLDISRIEAGREDVEITKFNVNSAIAEVVVSIEPIAKRKKIELFHKSKDADIIITSDADKFRHMIQNLIDNAVKFTGEGNVTVWAHQAENSIEIRVTDTGIGISAEHLPFIFEEFRQADESTSRRFGGTGLGLAISMKYANLLGGTISVTSTPGKGSEFLLTLPILYAAENRIEQEITADDKFDIRQQLPQSECGASDKRILLVEDNESAIIQIKDLVEEMGYRVNIARNGEVALGMIDQSIPDAIILDLMMPGIDGFKVLEILRNAEPTAHIPVLILTAKLITKEELAFLKRNNVHQLIQKGDVDRAKLQNEISGMLYPKAVEIKSRPTKVRITEVKPVVLVVEDNPDNMITAKAILADDFTVLEAVDAHEGIAMAKEHVPDLILMDIALSGMDGIQAFREIRSMPQLQHIPVIALTASAMLHDREAILSHGFDAFIAKPIIAKEFYKVIKEVLYG